MSRPRDVVEWEYDRAIARAIQDGDNDLALFHATGLSQYQESYKITEGEPSEHSRTTNRRSS